MSRTNGVGVPMAEVHNLAALAAKLQTTARDLGAAALALQELLALAKYPAPAVASRNVARLAYALDLDPAVLHAATNGHAPRQTAHWTQQPKHRARLKAAHAKARRTRRQRQAERAARLTVTADATVAAARRAYAQPTRNVAPTPRVHWMHRPENRARVLARVAKMAKASAKAKRTRHAPA